MSTELYLIRHGIAGERGSYVNDDERPLTEEGIRKTKQVAQRLYDFDVRLDLILTSPLVRAQQTARILQAAGLSKTLDTAVELAPGGSLQQWLVWLKTWQAQGGQRLAIVGHEPDLGEWAETLVWGEIRHRLIVKKAGVIGLLLPDGDAIGHSQLFWLTPPRYLR